MKSRVRKHTTDKHIHLQHIQLKKAFLLRMRSICAQMVGPGLFELLPVASLNDLYDGRYPPLKVMAGSPGVTREDMVTFREVLLALCSGGQVETLTGAKLDYPTYWGDGLLLIHYIEFHLQGGFKGCSRLLEAFAPYFTGSDWYRCYQQKTEAQLTMSLMYPYDFYKGYLDADINQLPIRNPHGLNIIRLLRVRPEIIHLRVKGVQRPLARVGWYDTRQTTHGTIWASIAPERLGFAPAGKSEQFPVYLQQHALARFQERSGLPPGFVAGYFNQLFSTGEPVYLRKKENTLVEFLVGGHKIGYFLLSIHQRAIVVRTFLFLTNNGTPEGNRLAALTRLKRLDQQFMGIDKMDTFFKYDIAGDPSLRNLFTQAGCGSLLDYVDEYAPAWPKMDGYLESPDFINKYLGNISGQLSIQHPFRWSSK